MHERKERKSKKNILVVDPLSYRGHANYDYGIVRILKKDYNCGIIINDYVANFMIQRGVEETLFVKKYPDGWSLAVLSKRMNKYLYNILFRYYYFRLLIYCFYIGRKYDIILFLRVDPYVFSLISFLFGKKCYVVDHGAGSIDSSFLYRLAWRVVKSDINLIVLEDFVKEMAQKRMISRNIYVVRHPLPDYLLSSKILHKHEKNEKILVFAPSSSNDDEFVTSLITKDIPSNAIIIARNNLVNHCSSNLILYKDFISNEKYNDYMSRADVILIPYNSSYNYRVSAVLFEALIMNKLVFLLSNNTLSYYNKLFGNSLVLFNTVDDLCELLHSYSCNIRPKDSSVLDIYGDNAILKELRNLFG